MPIDANNISYEISMTGKDPVQVRPSVISVKFEWLPFTSLVAKLSSIEQSWPPCHSCLLRPAGTADQTCTLKQSGRLSLNVETVVDLTDRILVTFFLHQILIAYAAI